MSFSVGPRLATLRATNAQAIIEFAEETGAEVLRGALRYPSGSGGWQLGDIDLNEYLAQYRDQIASSPCIGSTQSPILLPFLVSRADCLRHKDGIVG